MKFLTIARKTKFQALKKLYVSCNLGAANCIIVDRYNILETGMEETAGLHDPFLTLDIQFYGEVTLFLFNYIQFLACSFPDFNHAHV